MTTVTSSEATTAAPRTAGSRLGAWLLALSPLGFVLVVAANIAVFAPTGIGVFDDITRAQMDALGAQWALTVLTLCFAFVLGDVAVILVARGLRPLGGIWPVLAISTAVLAVVGAVTETALRISSARFSEVRLGDNGLYQASDVVSNVTFCIAALAIVMLAVSYYASGLHRTAGTVVGALAGVLVVVSVFAYAFVPPFALALLWLPLGVVWLRRPKGRSSAAI